MSFAVVGPLTSTLQPWDTLMMETQVGNPLLKNSFHRSRYGKNPGSTLALSGLACLRMFDDILPNEFAEPSSRYERVGICCDVRTREALKNIIFRRNRW